MGENLSSERTIPFLLPSWMFGHYISLLHTFNKSAYAEIKTLLTVETLTPKHNDNRG
jgi:hypothetical protein